MNEELWVRLRPVTGGHTFVRYNDIRRLHDNGKTTDVHLLLGNYSVVLEVHDSAKGLLEILSKPTEKNVTIKS